MKEDETFQLLELELDVGVYGVKIISSILKKGISPVVVSEFLDILHLPKMFKLAFICLSTGFILSPPAANGEVLADLCIRSKAFNPALARKCENFNIFLETGNINGRSLTVDLQKSGWKIDEIRMGMSRKYSVDIVSVSRYLNSESGIKFLKGQSANYSPRWGKKSTAIAALRSAILADSTDGKISSVGIMASLPVEFSFSDSFGKNYIRSGICAPSMCNGHEQCNSLLSWYVFLPACICANSK